MIIWWEVVLSLAKEIQKNRLLCPYIHIQTHYFFLQNTKPQFHYIFLYRNEDTQLALYNLLAKKISYSSDSVPSSSLPGLKSLLGARFFCCFVRASRKAKKNKKILILKIYLHELRGTPTPPPPRK